MKPTPWIVHQIAPTAEAAARGFDRVPYPFWITGINPHRNNEPFLWQLPFSVLTESRHQYDWTGAELVPLDCLKF